MLKSKPGRKLIAATLILVFATNTFSPTVALALTAGPTAPEATSFEPVDTTDMVNLQTGDLAYNIPLLEVPGPEGGYPLALSYHAGIEPNVEASWVGLGWSLNPGAINRNVNGYPDDWRAEQQTTRDYWNGGHQFTLGVDVGVTFGPATVSFGLTFGYDSYQGFGIGMNASAKIGISKNLAIAATIGFDPWGTPSASLGLAGALKSVPLSGMIGLSTNFSSISFGASVGLNVGGSGEFDGNETVTDARTGTKAANPHYGKSDGFGLKALGVSMSSGSGNTKASATVGGITHGVYNSNAGKIQTDGFSFGFALGIGLSFSYTRYWSDESTTAKSYGTLYDDYNGGALNSSYDDAAFDTYSLLDGQSNLVTNSDPYTATGPNYPDADLYTVLGQGLGGNIRPYHFQRHLLAQNRKTNTGTYLIKYYNQAPNQYTHAYTSFRFVNDFSNAYTQTLPDWDQGNLAVAPFDANPVIGMNDGINKYDATQNQLAGSKHVQWFNHIQIADGTAKSKGFVDNPSDGFARPNVNDPANDAFRFQIGGFSITNETGVTYHYGLPAYSKNEKVYTEKINTSLGDGHSDRWNTLKRPSKYAYTWYLTSVTGPDFVDRNNNGYADAGDWGYWANFTYGKWTDAYKWRNPAEGFIRDLDNNFQSYSEGEKEVYYLNKIATRTHTAIFEKNLRNDGKSAYPYVTGGSLPTTRVYQNSSRIDSYSEGTLRLEKIYLLNNSDLTGVSPSATTTLNKPAVNNSSATNPSFYYNFAGHLGTNVIDKYDIDPIRSTLVTKAVRVIEFNYDYSSCPLTTNSFDYSDANTKTGKLTLNSIAFKGKGGVGILPAMKFYYELATADQNAVSLTLQITDITKGIGTINTSNTLVRGDLITFTYNSKNYYAVVTDINKFKLVSTSGLSQTSYFVTVKKTKNPEYNKDAFDSWGMYKPDYDGTLSYLRENQRRMTSPASAKCTDVWSLRKIVSPYGAEINIEYESDSYGRPVLSGNASLEINNFTSDLANNRFSFRIQSLGYKVSDLFSVGDPVNLMMYRSVSYTQLSPCPYGIPPGTPPPTTYQTLGKPLTDASQTTGISVYSIDDANDRLTVTFTPASGFYFGSSWQSGTCYNANYDMGYIGNLWTVNNRETYGGGLRVKSIEVKNTTYNSATKTNYDYRYIGTNVSSGVTSYEPGVLDVPAVNDNNYKYILYADVGNLLKISREVPPPGVMYQYVSVTSSVKNQDEAVPYNIEGKTVYQFEVFNRNMLDMITLNSTFYSTNNVTIRNYTTRMGNLRRVITYDKYDRKLTEVVNNYLYDGLESAPFSQFSTEYNNRLAAYNNQGVIMERFAMNKEVVSGTYAGTPNRHIMSAREEYPSILLGQTTYNYQTNTTAKTQNLAFDFYSGAVTKKLDIDAEGNRFMTEITPAYRKYPDMGLKLNSSTQFGVVYPNKNMLTQPAATYIYKVDGSNNKTALMSADVQTWSTAVPAITSNNDNVSVTQNGNSGNGYVWRKQSSYSWLQDGKKAGNITPIGEFTDYNWANPSSLDPSWKKTGEVTLYDVFSKQLEETNVNGNYAATKMGYDNTRVIMNAAPAKYNEMAYSGAEDNVVSGKFGGNVSIGNGVVSTAFAHTGTSSVKVSASQTGFTYSIPVSQIQSGRDYFISAWAYSSNGAVPAGKLFYQRNTDAPVYSAAASVVKKAGSWYLLELKIPGSAVNGTTLTAGIVNSGSVDEYYDDFRFIPFNAGATSYVYDKLTGELTYTLDNNNLFSRFEYDEQGKLIRTYRETFQSGAFKTNEFVYNYGLNTVTYYSDAINNYYYSQNCTPPQTPVAYYVSVPQGTFTSTISPADANLQAQQYAQNQANLYGTCQAPPVSIYYSNWSSAYCYMIDMYNQSTGEEYWFEIPMGYGVLGDVPQGTYAVSIYMTTSCDYGNYRTFQVGCGFYDANYNNYANFYGVPINSSCYNVSIY